MQLRVIIVSSLMAAAFASPVLADDYVPNEVLVKWKDSPAASGVAAVSTIRVSDVETALELFAADDRVDYVEPNYKRYLAALPDDPDYFVQWYLDQSSDHDIDAEAAWEISTGATQVVVAVIDTGIDMNHPDLVDQLWTNPNEVADNGVDDDGNGFIDDVHGWDFIANDNNPSAQPSSSLFTTDYVLHGTHVAGTIGAKGDNGVGVTGVNWNVQIMPLKIFNDDGEGDTDGIAEAVEYAIANGADIINMSYGGSSSTQTEENVMTAAADAGIVLVAAAGNESRNLNTHPFYPACYDQVIGVGATDDADVITDFSNFGSNCVDVAAPGEFIYNTYYYDDTGTYTALNDEYGYMSGTSMATPVVSGIAGLVLATNPNLSASEVSDIIIATTDDIGDDTLGSGRVNAAQAVAAAVDEQNPEPVNITSYHSSSAANSIAEQDRTRDASPYFSWDEPVSLASVAGYYVYFGRERLNPITDGILQSSRSYTPVEALHGNERTYRLRIRTLDSEGRTSDLAQFEYVIDRRIKRPTWQSLKATTDGVQLRWYKPSADHAIAYKVYRSTDRDGQYQSISGEISLKKFTDTQVRDNQRYYYRVRAIDDLGNESELGEIKTIKL